MQKDKPLQGKWPNVVFFLTAFLIVVADQLTKMWIRGYLPEGHSVPLTSFLKLTRIHNTGGAFGLFQGQTFPLIIVSIIGVVLLIAYALFIYRRFPSIGGVLSKSALGLILGGTIGNLIGRIYFGYVTDFVDFGFWPAFNVADSAVVIGVIIFAYSLHSLFETAED